MNDLAPLVPGDIDFPIMDGIFGASSNPPYMEIVFVLSPLLLIVVGIWLHNKNIWKLHGGLSVFIQSTARVFLDIALVVGICAENHALGWNFCRSWLFPQKPSCPN